MSDILIIEDDVINQLVLKKLLNKKLLNTHEAENGQAGLDILKTQKNISHVVLDLNLPVMDGYSVIDHINQNDEFSHLRIYVISCYSKSAFSAKMQNRNIDTKQVVKYYEKPLMMDELVEEIATNVQLA